MRPVSLALLVLLALLVGRVAAESLTPAGEDEPSGVGMWVASGSGETTPWERQEVHVYVDIYWLGGSVDIGLDPWVQDGVHIRPLGWSRRRETVDGVPHSVERRAWSVMPLSPGRHELQLPQVQVRSYRHYGSTLFYPVEPVTLAVRALPGYLPTELPVGRVRVEEQRLPPAVGIQRPGTWELRLVGTGLGLQAARAALASLAEASDAFRIYPPQLRLGPAGAGHEPEQAIEVTIPFVPLRAGEQPLPSLAFPYVDADSGRLEVLTVPGPVLRVGRPWLAEAGRGLTAALLMVAWAGGAAWLGAHLARRRRRRRREALAAIAGAKDLTALTRRLLAWDADAPPGRPATLRQWLAAMRSRYGDRPALVAAVTRLERARYADQAVPLARLRRELLSALRALS